MSKGATADPTRASRRALLVALGVDNLGSGLFLPLAVVYITTVVGIPLATAGLLVTAGTLVGLLAPPLAGGLVDRVGPRTVVVVSQVLQVTGMVTYLLAGGPASVLLAAALVADVAPAGPRDHTFAVVEMVRSAAFGVGALVAAVLVSTVDVSVLRAAVALDAVSFLVSGVLLVALVRPRPHGRTAAPPGPTAEGGDTAVSVLANRPYLALIAVTTLLGLPGDFLLVGLAVYLRELAPGSEWAAGVSVAALTASGFLTVAVVRLTSHWRRTTSMAAGGYCLAAWAVFSLAAVWLPTSWVGPWMLSSMVLLAGGGLLFGTRVNALAEAAAPAASRGRHLAAFQYSFTAAGLLAPLLVSAMAVGLWLPWVLVGAAALLGAVAVPLVGRRLPPAAVRPPP